MYKIEYSNQATLDVNNMVAQIAKESMNHALDYLQRYESKIQLLRLNPFMGVECHTKNINRNCRILVFESHIIIYKVDNISNLIVISRVYHGKSEYQKNYEKKSW